jgi:glycosyltransferase involved in cell wall biosynthesis
VYDQHDLAPELLLSRFGHRPLVRGVLRFFEACSYRMASLVVAPNESYREIAVGRGKRLPEDVVIVRNGPDSVAAPPVAPAADGPPVVAFAGVMGPQDGVSTLISAMAILLQRRAEPVVLELMGKGPAVAALRQQVTRLGIDHAVRWAGWVHPDEMRRRLSMATVAASVDEDNPFTRRSTMIKVMDYLALGVPAVVSDLPENRVSAGEAALYFRPGDAEDLALRIEDLLDDEQLRSDLSQRGRVRAETLLWRHSASALINAYEALLAKP